MSSYGNDLVLKNERNGKRRKLFFLLNLKKYEKEKKREKVEGIRWKWCNRMEMFEPIGKCLYRHIFVLFLYLRTCTLFHLMLKCKVHLNNMVGFVISYHRGICWWGFTDPAIVWVIIWRDLEGDLSLCKNIREGGRNLWNSITHYTGLVHRSSGFDFRWDWNKHFFFSSSFLRRWRFLTHF